MEQRISTLGMAIWPREFQRNSLETAGDKRTVYSIAGNKRKVEMHQIEKKYIKLEDLDKNGDEISNPPPLSEEIINENTLERGEETIIPYSDSFNFESQNQTQYQYNSEINGEGNEEVPSYNNNNETPSQEINIHKDECFFCQWYRYPKDIPEGPVRLLLEMIEDMLFKGRSDLENIYNQAYIYYNENVFNPAIKIGKNLPVMTRAKIKIHFEEHIEHNPAIFTYVSIKQWLKMKTILLNKSFHKLNDEDDESGIYTDTENVKLALKVQQELNSLYKTKLNNMVFGSENIPNLKNAGNFINDGPKMTDTYKEYFNNRDD
jgi:hypothetical protein